MNTLFFLSSAKNFCESLLIGNGRIGGTVYGGVNEDVYSFNDDTLWTGYPQDHTFDGRELFQEAKKSMLADDVENATARLKRLYGAHSQSYLPAGDLIISADYGEYFDYRRVLSLDDAVHTTEFKTPLDRYTRKAFASCPDDIICIRYDCKGQLPEMRVSLKCKLRPTVCFENDVLFLEGEAPGNGVPSYISTEKRFPYSDEPSKRGMRYVIALKIKTDGEYRYEDKDGSLRIQGASFLELRLTLKTSFAGYDKHPFLEGIDYKSEAIKILEKSDAVPYEDLLARHIDDYSSLFSRVEFELDGNARPDLPTDERLRAHQAEPDLGIYPLMYQFGRYLMISSSRKGAQPLNLQGIWNVEMAPPWSSNYTVNINTQMNYWGMCGANLSECCDSLHQMIYELAESGKKTAKNLFGAEGFCVNHNVDIWRISHPVGNWSKDSTHWSYFPVAGAWLARHLYDYYLETSDIDFLNGKAFTAIIEAVRFCDSMLTQDRGQLIFCPASSPENQYVENGVRYAIAKSSTMYQSIVRDIFEICIEVCRITGRELEYAQYLEERLKRIPWLRIGKDGRILEWDEEREEHEMTHRHLSHLYSFYPAKKVSDKALLDACRRSLEARGDKSTGWSSIWKVCLWATLGDGERALALVDTFLFCLDPDVKDWRTSPGGIYPNLLCACPPFQIDGNYGFVAAVNEMLVQEIDGKVQVLPALPERWKNGKVKGLRIHGKTVDAQWHDGKITSVRIE